MEFPDLGSNCSKSDCRVLACGKLYCKEHYLYERHGCSNPHDVQVPACPLCGVTIPLDNRSQPPDVFVERHILTNCTSQPAKSLKGKIFTNKCSVPKCKVKETVQINCKSCHKSFCLRHRLEADHDCGNYASLTANRINKTLHNSDAALQKKLQEEEDHRMALALQQSLNTTSSGPTNQNSAPLRSTNRIPSRDQEPSKCSLM